MLRSSRTIVSLVRHLMLGTAGTLAVAAVSTTLVGCKDESQPEYWVEKLSDASWRPRAVKRLEQFYEDSVTKAGKKEDAPEVKALLDKIVEPLTKTYVDNYGDLDGKSRVSLIKLLSAFNDPRTEPALKKAFEEFAKKPATSKDDTDIKWAVRATASLKLASLADPMLQAFSKLRASSMLGGVTYKDFNEAMTSMPQKSWAGPLTALLEVELERPGQADSKDAAKIDAYRDQQFWQLTAVQVLGEVGDEGTVEPLLKVMLDPQKADIQADTLIALVKLGKFANPSALKLLTAPMDDKLATFHAARVQKATGAKEAPKDSPHIATAALIVGTIGRAESLTPMIEALGKADKDVNRAVIARELTKIPATDASKAAFKAAFEKISIEANIPPGYNALQLLAEASGSFFDASMVDWLLSRATATKGEGEAIKALQGAILVTAIKLAKPDQLPTVKKVVDSLGTQIEKDFYAQAEKLTKECGDRAACYISAMEKGENQDQKNQLIGVKAGYMVAILGTEKERDELVAGLSSIENASIRFVAASAIDFLSPKGSTEAADKLAAIIEKNKKSGDANRMAGDAPLRQVMVRIRSRAS